MRRRKGMDLEVFADNMGQISFAGGMVRYDFVSVRPGEDGAAPVAETKVRVIMPPQGFLSACNSMQQLVGKLVEAGVLQRNDAVEKVLDTAEEKKPVRKRAARTRKSTKSE